MLNRQDGSFSSLRTCLQKVTLLALVCSVAWKLTSVAAHSDATTEAADLVEQYTAVSNSSLRWLQRPNLYFGMRARVQGDSPLFGLAWFGTQDYNGYQKIRHSCEQGDNLGSYNWIMHDGRSSGVQEIFDTENNVKLTIELLKTPGGIEGGSWAARISGQPVDQSKPSRISLITYYGLEGFGTLQVESHEDETEGLEGDIELTGSVTSLGAFRIRQVETHKSRPNVRGPHAEDYGDLVDRIAYLGMPVPQGSAWRAKDLLLHEIVTAAKEKVARHGQNSPPDPAILFSLPNEFRSGSNFFAFQKTHEDAFALDIFYEAQSTQAGRGMDSNALTSGIHASAAAYDARFEETFGLLTKGYTGPEIAFAKALTANIVGGIGYFYGPSIIDRNFRYEYDEEEDDDEDASNRRQPKPELTAPYELFTATPSRSFFPRGFYWDEGFHLMLIGAWDNDLSLDILRSWINLIDENGWVGREQILGEEARSKVPEEFRTQYPAYGNPPTLPMGVTSYIRRLKSRPASQQTPDSLFSSEDTLGSPSEMLASLSSTSSPKALSEVLLSSPHLARAFLQTLYPKLRRHYYWFRETQRGQLREWGRKPSGSRTEAYRWRGRSNDHVLTSGLDDYPRAKPPHIGELHLDLTSWMAFFTRTMHEIAEHIGEKEDAQDFAKIERAILTNLEELHWSEQDQMYCDLSVDEDDESIHVCHQGYISIFPFLLGLLKPDSAHLGAILKAIRDPEQLWSNYGLRSLSKSHPLNGQGEDYWRGPIWIPLNYLALQSLYTRYAKESGPYQQEAAEIYDELRTNIVSNVYKEYARTGYAWEQYDANDGKGRRSHPFTGWTSLVTLIMAEQY